MTAAATSPGALPRALRAAPLRHAEHVMGTVFSFTVRDAGLGARRVGVEAALRRAVARLHGIDRVFSPYWRDSQVSRLARAESTLADCDPELAEVLERCREVARETDGWFTAYPGGRLDPSGWVKGWAVEEAVRILREAGAADFSVGGGGDVQCVGGPWRVGVAHPARPGALVAVVAGHDLAVATSGTAERGPHILDPHTGRPATGLLSLTLVGRRLARTDAWATAAFAMGPDRGPAWVEARAGVEALAVLPDGRRRWTSGFPALVAPGVPLGRSGRD
ncbi:FAD:protein FMN transferase [Kitasatospora sp. NPDC057015]|uniref:FAD:protein FMN transferase n=1 Tax=Kitasatospora sp. NPDC057015 TaxID=3346001 RepID=UPI00363CBEE9